MNAETERDVRQFVEREIIFCQTGLVEMLLRKGYEVKEIREQGFDIDNIKDFYSYPEFYGVYANFGGGIEEYLDEAKEELREKLSEMAEDEEEGDPILKELLKGQTKYEKMQEELEELNDLDSEPQEVFEWWLVTNWLAEKLRCKGEPTLETDWGTYWGRCTTGQMICADYVINKIYEDLYRKEV